MAIDIEDIGFPPPHPGEILREDILPNLDMSVTALAKHLGVTRQTLSRLLNERSSVSTEMAQKLGRAFGNGARFWLAMQLQHDLWRAEQDDGIDVKPLEWRQRSAA